jgi:hypothetical protein
MRKHVDAMQAEMTRPTYSWGSDADGTADFRYRRGVDDGLGGASGALASHWDLTATRAVAGWLVREAGLLDSHVFPQSDPAMESYPLAVALGYLGEEGGRVTDITDEGTWPVPDWTYIDGDGDKLTLRAGVRSLLLRVASYSGDVAVAAADVPEFAAELYKAAGLPAPVILDRPAASALNAIPGIIFERNGPVIEACRPGGSWQFTPTEIRRLAASLAILADEVDSGPGLDEDEVRDLARVIHRTHCDDEYCRLSPTLGDVDAARAALRWKRERGTAS